MILNNFENYIDVFSDVLSIAYEYKYSLKVIEKRIVYSPYFSILQNNIDDPILYATKKDILRQFFIDFDIDFTRIKKYNECLWVSEAYLNIMEHSGCTIEVIFLYIPLKDMYNYFSIYHEMDFSQIRKRFTELYSQTSILSIASKRIGKTLQTISLETDISYSMLSALSSRQRDIKKLNGIHLYKLSQSLQLKIESLLCDYKKIS